MPALPRPPSNQRPLLFSPACSDGDSEGSASPSQRNTNPLANMGFAEGHRAKDHGDSRRACEGVGAWGWGGAHSHAWESKGWQGRTGWRNLILLGCIFLLGVCLTPHLETRPRVQVFIPASRAFTKDPGYASWVHDVPGNDNGPADEGTDSESGSNPAPVRYPPLQQQLRLMGGGCQTPAVRQNRTIVWSPPEDVAQRKYILLHCFIGQMSNRKLCILNHMILAGLLNRTLVVPRFLNYVETGVPKYDLLVVWDLQRVQSCLGSTTVITVDQYFEEQGIQPTKQGWFSTALAPPAVPLDAIHCVHGPMGFCPQGDDIPGVASGCPLKEMNTSKEGSATLAPGGDRWLRHALYNVSLDLSRTRTAAPCLGRKATVQSLVESYSASGDARMIMAGDLEAMDFQNHKEIDTDEERLLAHPELNYKFWLPLGGLDPFRRSEECLAEAEDGQAQHQGLILPPPPILNAAKQLAVAMFGTHPYLAFHWRRGDFKEYCTGTSAESWCYRTPEEVAECVSRVMLSKNLTRIYLASNGEKEEIQKLRSALRHKVKNLRLRAGEVKDISRLESTLRALGGVDRQEQEPTIRTVLEKALAAHGAVFLGSERSTFSMDIYRMRIGLGRSTTCDSITTIACAGLAIV